MRQTGTIVALEWETGEGTSYFSNLRDKLYHHFLNRGIVLRPLGNVIYILPPYCITDNQLTYIYAEIERRFERFSPEVGKTESPKDPSPMSCRPTGEILYVLHCIHQSHLQDFSLRYAPFEMTSREAE